MNTKELKKHIFEQINSFGTISTKCDVLGDEPMEDKVYTKKISIDKDYGNGPNGIEVACVSLTSTTENFKDVSINNIRINTKNRQGQWCNIFINEASKDLLEFVCKNIK